MLDRKAFFKFYFKFKSFLFHIYLIKIKGKYHNLTIDSKINFLEILIPFLQQINQVLIILLFNKQIL